MEFGAGRPARFAGRLRESGSGGALRAGDGGLAFGAFRMWGLPVPAPGMAQTLSASREGNYEPFQVDNHLFHRGLQRTCP